MDSTSTGNTLAPRIEVESRKIRRTLFYLCRLCVQRSIYHHKSLGSPFAIPSSYWYLRWFDMPSLARAPRRAAYSCITRFKLSLIKSQVYSLFTTRKQASNTLYSIQTSGFHTTMRKPSKKNGLGQWRRVWRLFNLGC